MIEVFRLLQEDGKNMTYIIFCHVNMEGQMFLKI